MYEIEKRKVIEEIEKFFDSAGVNKEHADGVREVREDRTNTLLKQLGINGISLCGGAITSIFSGASVKDLDFYVSDTSLQEGAISLFKEWFGEPTFRSMNALTFKRKSTRSNKVWTVQLITRFTGDSEAIFKNFDFTVTMGSYNFLKEEFELHPRFLTDVARRRLVYSGASFYPICALARTRKYMDKGYHCPNSTLMHIALSIVQLNIRNYKELKAQLFGIDTIYLQNLLSSKKYEDYIANDVPVDYGEFIADVFTNMEGPIPEAEVFGDE
jgi:hypothetical protein